MLQGVTSRFSLVSFVFVVINFFLFGIKYFFQTSQETAVILTSCLGTLEELKSQKSRVNDNVETFVLLTFHATPRNATKRPEEKGSTI